MRRRPGTLAAIAALAAFAAGILAAAGCSSEQISLTMGVSAAPNPVAGTNGTGGRSWEYRISITNPHPAGVRVEYFHSGITGTDTGYEQPLLVEKEFSAAGAWIAPGGTLTFPASRHSGGRFSRGTERRIYHTLGDDGKYYSGEVLISLE